ncbi:hypothetical protein [Aeromicrobium alkaliterrae]|uniref:PknH-like extracellular domain-containing protein n=1 Tax=Aeromicrobium alkaliterrae TaxID=302168 RepID=A0ABN2JZ20_9ACTN
MTTWRNAVVSAAAVLALGVLAACGGGDPDPEPSPDPSPSKEQEGREITGQLLRSALLRIDDIPAGLGTDFASARQAEVTGADSVTDGPEECSEYLEAEYGGEETDRFDDEYRDDVAVTAVYTSIRSFEDGDVDDELEAIRDIFAVCDRFEITPADQPIEVTTTLDDFADLDGFEDIGEDGLRLTFALSVDGAPTRTMYYHFIQIGDFVAQAGGQVAADGDPAPFLDLVLVAEEKLQDLVDEVG